MLKKQSKEDKIILILNYILLSIMVFSVLVPLVYIIIASFTDPNTLLNNGISLNPKTWTIQGYSRIFKDKSILLGVRNSLFYAFTFSVISVAITLLAAYPLSRKDFIGKRFIMAVFIFTMFFNGGLIPTYLLVKDLNILNTIWSILLPSSVNVWNIILAKAYFQGIPSELMDAAVVDGCSHIQCFFRVFLPLSKPIIAVLFLYQFVNQWNSYFDAMIYLKDTNLQPLQIILRSILIENQPVQGMIGDAQDIAQLQKIAQIIKYSSIVVSSLPLLLVYPFFQKFFEKGILMGSIKE